MLSVGAATERLVPAAWRPGSRFAALAVAVLLTVGAGMISANRTHLLFALSAAAILVAITLRWLLAGAVLFIVLTFPSQLPGSIGTGATIAKPFGVVLVCSWAFALLNNRGRPFLPRDRPVLSAFLAAYFSWALLSMLWTASPGDTRQNLQRLALSLTLVLVLFTVASTAREFIILMSGYVAASALTSIYVLASGVSISGGRVTGGVSDPNYLASELVLATISAGYLLGATRRRALRLVLLAIIGVDITVFLLAQSRGGIIGMAVATLVSLIVAGRTRGMVIALTALAVAVTVGYVGLFAPAQVRHRVTNFSSSASAGRTDTWQIAWRIAKSNPFTGVALGGYRNEQLKYAASSIDIQHINYIIDTRVVVHNTYLETLAELGMIGVVALGGAILIALRTGWKAMRVAEAAGDHALANVLRGLVAGSCGLFTAYLFVSAEYEKQLWFALAMLAAAKTVAVRRTGDASTRGESDRVRLTVTPR